MHHEGFIDVSRMATSGVYALLRKKEVVYIGQAKIMLVRLYTHYYNKRQRNRYKGKVMSYDGMWIKPCIIGELDRLEQSLIKKYQPMYNVHHQKIPLDIKELLTSIVGTMPPIIVDHPFVIGKINRRI